MELFMYIIVWLSCYPREVENHAYGSRSQKQRLFEDLMIPYNKLARPVANSSHVLSISFRLLLEKIHHVHEKIQMLEFSGRLNHAWTDHKLRWNPWEYNNETFISLPAEMVWLPDIILYNNADGTPHVSSFTWVHVYYSGHVFWDPPVRYNSMCAIDIRWFPYDEQHCSLKFGSWTYGDSVTMEFLARNDTIVDSIDENTKVVHACMDCLDEYSESQEWDLMSFKATKHSVFYPCCVNPYIDITYDISIRRKSLFYTVNLVIPCIAIACLTCCVFFLPSNSNMKINLSVSLLVVLSVFLLLLFELIPPVSTAVPLVARYILFTLFLISLSIFISICVLNIHYTSASRPMPHWVRRTFIHVIPTMIFWNTRRIHKGVHPQVRRYLATQPNTTQQRAMVQTNANARRLYRACQHVCYIAEHVKKLNAEWDLSADWQFVATVIDRIFLVIFTVSVLVFTTHLLFAAPTVWDTRAPLVTVPNKHGIHNDVISKST